MKKKKNKTLKPRMLCFNISVISVDCDFQKLKQIMGPHRNKNYRYTLFYSFDL